VFTGPPVNRKRDAEIVKRFVQREGDKIVCGGTTAKIVARVLGRPLDVDLKTITRDIPPSGRIEGIDLASEGIITLTEVHEMLLSGIDRPDGRNDGAATLLSMLLDADHVHFIVGLAENPVHRSPGLPRNLKTRAAVVRGIAEALKKRGKKVTLETV